MDECTSNAQQSVAADLETGEAVRLGRGDLVDAMRASMAIPLVFTPVRIDGRLLVDGGLVRNLPVQDAREIGADLVIGVDASDGLDYAGALNSLVDIFGQSFDVSRDRLLKEQRALADVLIEPDMPDVEVLDFSSVETVIKKGEEAARAMLPRIHELVDSLHQHHGAKPQTMCHAYPPQTVRAPATPTSLYISSVEVQGLKRVSPDLVLDLIPHQFPGRITRRALTRMIERIYATQLFERVTPRLASTPRGDDRLVIKVTEKARQVFRVGLRYDTDSHTSVLLNATLRSPKRELERRLSGLEHRFDWRAAFPVNAHLSLISEWQFSASTALKPGAAVEETLPLLEAEALLGGAHTPLLETGQFVGLAKHERRGKYVKALMVGAQYEFRPGYFAVLRANVGNTSDVWAWDFRGEGYVAGAGLTLGKVTALGPVQCTIATSNRHALLIEISLGQMF